MILAFPPYHDFGCTALLNFGIDDDAYEGKDLGENVHTFIPFH
jgi:hypothetical protein